MIPALFTSAFTPPISFAAQATNAWTSSSLDTSRRRRCTPAGSSASFASFTSPAATVAPASASRRAKWAPIPWAPPVTITFRSRSSTHTPSKGDTLTEMRPVRNCGLRPRTSGLGKDPHFPKPEA